MRTWKNKEILKGNLDKFYRKSQVEFEKLSKEINHSKPEELFCNGDLIINQLQGFTVAYFGKGNQEELEVKFNVRPQPSFNKQFDLLIEDLNVHHSKGYDNYIFCANEKQAQRFHDIFEDSEETVHYETVVFPIYQGFIL